MRCLSCKYDLRKLTEHRCPECGRAFDPNDPKTIDTTPRYSPTVRIIVLISVVTFIGCLLWHMYDIRANELVRPSSGGLAQGAWLYTIIVGTVRAFSTSIVILPVGVVVYISTCVWKSRTRTD